MIITVLFLKAFIVSVLLDSAVCVKITPNQRERISILREEIKREIENVAGDLKDNSSQEEYDYMQFQKLPITPIMVTKKIQQKNINPPKLKSTSKSLSISSPNSTDNVTLKIKRVKIERSVKIDRDLEHRNTSLRSKKQKFLKLRNKHTRKPIEIFYRRIYNRDFIDNPSQWVHCQDMITPYLTGAKKDITHPKRLSANDPTILRFFQLLKVDTSLYGRDDIYSILYQINNLQLRLFQWEVAPLNVLFNILMKDHHKHHFGRLKSGIRELFRNWRMDITNITNLLKQTRIFRPPCIQISKYDGSTKSPRVTTYTKTTRPSISCDDDDDC